MATKKISQLPPLATLLTAGKFEVSLNGKSYQIGADVIFAFIASQIAAGGLDFSGAAALGFNIFSVGPDEAPADWDFGWGGDPVDLRYLQGLWITLFLDKDTAYKTVTHKEASKNEIALAIHITSYNFAGEPYRAIALVAVQGTAARIAEGNVIGGGLPDRLIYPRYGAVGGYEMIKVFADNKTMAGATSRDELDGNGARHGFDVRIHQLIDEDSDGVQTWMTGRALNDSDGPSNFPDHPSARFGLRSTVDTSGSEPVTTKLEFVVQYALPTETPGDPINYADVMAWTLGTGLVLPGGQIGFDPTGTDLVATDVQAALVELEARVAALEPS